MVTTRLCEMLGIKYPIIQAGMGPFGTNRLCVAASNAGVLGLISSSALVNRVVLPGIYEYFCTSGGAQKEDELHTALSKILKNTAKNITEPNAAYGVNVMVSAEIVEYARKIIDSIIQTRNEDTAVKKYCKVIVTSAGDPVPWTDAIKPSGLTWFHVCASAKAAQRCKKAGVDGVIVSGHEGGFHTSWEPVHTMILLPAVVDEIGNLPVVGAGGFSDARSLVAALALGADGVQMGTRFLTTHESDFPDNWKQHVVNAGDRCTLIARGLVGPARMLKTPASEAHAEKSLKGSPGVFLGKPDDWSSVPPELLFSEIKALEAVYSGDENIAMYPAGEIAQRISDIPKVKDMVVSIMRDVEDILEKLPGKFIK
jgi:NAD(P)H-dependent flavin oxidoreductase YrpB (nitropropane dioxygenase family)